MSGRVLVRPSVLALLAVLAVMGCATVPHISRGSPNYVQTGMVSARFRGNEFYMVIGEVDLYQYDVFGNLKPTGQTVEIAAVVQADRDTGEILRIATLQSLSSHGATVLDASPQVLANLRGGMSVIDAQPYPHWLDAVQAMRTAITQLDTYTQFAAGDEKGPVVVAVVRGWWWPRHRHWR